MSEASEIQESVEAWESGTQALKEQLEACNGAWTNLKKIYNEAKEKKIPFSKLGDDISGAIEMFAKDLKVDPKLSDDEAMEFRLNYVIAVLEKMTQEIRRVLGLRQEALKDVKAKMSA